jgi:hypothetical protein
LSLNQGGMVIVTQKLGLFVVSAFSFATLVGCTGGSGGSSVGSISFPGVTLPEAHADGATPAAVVGDSCKTGAPNQLCLAVKYVGYQNSSGVPTVSQEEAIANMKQINKLWQQCSIGFQIENYSAIVPKDHGLRYNTANMSELNDIRKVMSDDTTLLVTTTGTWDRGGSLGDTGANAWAAMPGENLYGVVFEKAVATFGNIIAHELGHYVGLDHGQNSSNLMNPIIYDDSTKLTQSQCNQARETIGSYWQKMVRA